MGLAFSGWAEFSRMSPTPMWIEHVVHKTYIKVDEQGTEAAAVAAAVLAESLVERFVFRVDRPFAFTIRDRQTGTIRFLGTVTDPRG